MMRRNVGKQEHFFREGVLAGILDHPMIACPAAHNTMQQAWMAGWRRGRLLSLLGEEAGDLRTH